MCRSHPVGEASVTGAQRRGENLGLWSVSVRSSDAVGGEHVEEGSCVQLPVALILASLWH